MTPVPTSPPPGSLTVPPLFGWEHVLTALVLLALLALAGLAVLAAGRGRSAREDWLAWLDSRTAQRGGRAAPDEHTGSPS